MSDTELYKELLQRLSPEYKVKTIRVAPIDTLILSNHFKQKKGLTFSGGLRSIYYDYMRENYLHWNYQTIKKLLIEDEVKAMFLKEYEKYPEYWEKFEKLFNPRFPSRITI